MIIIGLILLVAALVFGADVLWKNTDTVPEPTAFGETLNVTTSAGLIGIGIAIGAVGVLGLVLLLAGLSRRATKARGRKHRMKSTTQEKERLERENEELRASRPESSTDAPRESADADRS